MDVLESLALAVRTAGGSATVEAGTLCARSADGSRSVTVRAVKKKFEIETATGNKPVKTSIPASSSAEDSLRSFIFVSLRFDPKLLDANVSLRHLEDTQET